MVRQSKAEEVQVSRRSVREALFKLIKTISILLLFLSFISCKTSDGIERFDKGTMMFAMIYDYDNSGVSAVDIYINDEYLGTSDFQGRYIIEKGKEPNFKLKFEKNGYEAIDIDVFFDPFSVLYIKMGTSNQFLQLAEDELDAYLYTNALDYVNRSLALAPERIDAIYLKAIILSKLEDFDGAEQELLTLEEKSNVAKYVALFLEKNRKAREEKNL